jgi:hypothetical protein
MHITNYWVISLFITHVQPSAGFGSMGSWSGRFFYTLSLNAIT